MGAKRTGAQRIGFRKMAADQPSMNRQDLKRAGRLRCGKHNPRPPVFDHTAFASWLWQTSAVRSAHQGPDAGPYHHLVAFADGHSSPGATGARAAVGSQAF